jgi:hypothetical protein
MIIKPSKRNSNLHTDKGMQLLETSIDKVGVIESISVTQEGTIISGHARKVIFDKKGMVAKEIKLAENESPVIVTEIEDNTKEYFEAQILANTTANKNFNLDIEVIEVIAEEYDIEIEEVGVEIEDFDKISETEQKATKSSNDMPKRNSLRTKVLPFQQQNTEKSQWRVGSSRIRGRWDSSDRVNPLRTWLLRLSPNARTHPIGTKPNL